MHIVSIVGARPQYIKLAPLHNELERLGVRHQTVNTGQHYDHNLAQIFFDQLSLPKPVLNLGVGSGSNSEMTALVLEKSAQALRKLRPDLLIVYGDTNSTLGAALAGAQLGIPLAHVESGLRCFDLSVPEELNRVITDRISQYLFCPTGTAVDNLKREAVVGKIYRTGDVLYDVMKLAMPRRAEMLATLANHNLEPEKYLLLTLHRAGTVDDKASLSFYVEQIAKIKEPIVFPLHPRTRRRLKQFRLMGQLRSNPHLRLIEPCGYRETLALTAQARMVLTDSGGLQREAYRLRVPVLIIRDTTEWVEIIKSGGGMIVGRNAKLLREGLQSHKFRFRDTAFSRSGAAARIARHLLA